MANIVIPTTSTTQTLTGDNGLSTVATFTANSLEAPFWSRTGVGLRGSNYAPSNDPALEVDFSNTVEDVQFTLFDVDQATGSWDDQIRVEAYDPDGNPIPITYTTTGTGHVVESNGLDGNLQIEASNNDGDNQSSIIVNIAGPVGSFKIFYEDGTTDTNDAGVINLESMSFSDVTPPDGTVTGTAGDDIIDGTYLGDPNGDIVDNNDAILAGDLADDDLIYGFGGDDSISAGAGDDEAYGGTGDDTIDGGAGNDFLVGDQSTLAGGQDTITGGAGNDTIYGDSAGDTNASAGTSTFSWSTLGVADGADVSGGLTGTTANGDVAVTMSVAEGTNFTSAAMETTDTLYDYDGQSDTSSIAITGGSSGTSSGAAVVTLDFEGNDPGYHDEVSNVTFGIFDLDRFAGQFTDEVTIRAYDADGNLVPVTLSTVGNGNTTINTTSNPDGTAQAVADNAAGNTETNLDAGFVQVSVAGPVSKIVIEYANTDPAYGAHAIRIGDLEVTSIPVEDGIGENDSLDGGIGDDVIFGQGGDDIIAGGTGDDVLTGGFGDDTFIVENNFGSDTIDGSEDAGNGDVDVLDASTVTSDVTLDLSAVNTADNENGTLTSGADVTTFDNIETVILGSGDDTIVGSSGNDTIVTGAGADTVTMGAGDDIVNLGDATADITGGVPDGDDDVVVLEDGFGDDIVSNFDAPTPAGGGLFTGIDTLDVTNLYDRPAGDPTREPVNTNDVVVTDDGSGNAVLTFPNGESLTLIGIPAADADDPFYLNAIGIPLPDGTVSGSNNGDLIDGSYLGDPDGDIVDNNDAILTGDAANDDLIEANGGNDTVFAADGDDEVYGGTGDDTIDGGVGNDTLFGEDGSDIFTIADADGTDTITGGEDVGGADVDTVDFSGVTGTDGVTVTYDGDESADYAVGATGSDGTFDEIEGVIGTDNADVIDATLDTAGFIADTGAGDDTIIGGAGDDDITAGTGDDQIVITDGFGNDTIDGGADAGNGDVDVLDGSSLTEDLTVDMTAPEAGTISNGTDTTSFSEIEEIVLGSGDDSVIGSAGDDVVNLGQGTDTINAGAGDDQINLGEDSPGNPDQDPDVVVLEDGFGNDIVTNFDAPTDNLDGTFTGIDTLDVTNLFDAPSGDPARNPVNTNDVVVSDDGSGNAVLTFPNGETITLDGISPADADNPFYLNAIGIPMPEDGIVTGTQGDDLIDGSYNGDLEGDFVDSGDALVAGEAPNDDIILAQGGDDSVLAGAGADDIYGGDGSDTIDAGAGDDTVYGDTPDGAWHYEYFDLDPTGNPTSLADAGFVAGSPDYDGTPTSVGYTDSLNPADIDSADDFAIKYSSTLIIDTAGDYTFRTGSDDGSKMFIDGVEVVNNDGLHALTYVDGTPVTLTAGEHTIDIIYFENDGGNSLEAFISGPDTGGVQTSLTGYDGLRAATGDDIIIGGTGDDTLFGGAGDDTVIVSEADNTDTITGGEDADGSDIDTVTFDSVGTTDGVDVSFTGDEAADYQVGTTGSDGSFTEIERVVGTDNDDTIDLTNDTSGITVESGTGDDTITSGAGDDVIDASTGDDTVALNDNFGNDDIVGGEDVGNGDTDVLDATGVTVDTTLDLTAPETGTLTDGTDTATLAEIEQFFLGSGNDTATGSTGDDFVDLGAGDDTINAGAGDDAIAGGTGDDEIVLTNGFGDDTITGGEDADDNDVDVLNASDITVDTILNLTSPETGTLTDGTDTASLAEIEQFFLGSGDDSATGSAGDDIIDLGAGDDSINAGAGDDNITAGTGTDTIAITDGFGNDTIDAGEDVGNSDVDVLDGSSLTDDVTVTLTGDEVGTVTDGVDTLDFTGVEEIVTGSGDDTVVGGTGDDSVSTGAGADVISTGEGADTINAGDGDDIITFSEGDSIAGGDGNDTFTLEDLGEPTNGVITVTGGDGDEAPVDPVAQTGGDILKLGDLADLTTLVQTSDGINASGNETFSGSVELDDGTTLNFSGIEQVICFTPGTNIATPHGSRPIETLRVGDLVVTRDHGMQPIRWIQQRTVPATDKFAPVRLRPGVVTGLERDLLVSPQHRMLFQGYRAELLFGESEVLMPATHLIDDKMVTREEGGFVTYIHMMFDEHEVVYAEGAASESFHPGEIGLTGVADKAREELFALFPALRSDPKGYGRTARRTLKQHESQMLRTK